MDDEAELDEKRELLGQLGEAMATASEVFAKGIVAFPAEKREAALRGLEAYLREDGARRGLPSAALNEYVTLQMAATRGVLKRHMRSG